MEIDLNILEKASKKIFAHLNELGLKTIKIDLDFYWHIIAEEKYNPYKKPANLNIGQLEDNIKEIKDIANGKKNQ